MKRKFHRPDKRDFARQLRRDQTDSEKKLWALVRSRTLLGFKFRRQYTVGPFIVDFCCPARKLLIELDGGQHSKQKDYDKERTLYLKAKGFRVLRFWDNEILKTPHAVLDRILFELDGPLTPTLSPVRGEGD